MPFATEDGKPIKIKTGRVMSEPPPAIVLIKPTIIPIKNSAGYSHGMFKNISKIILC